MPNLYLNLVLHSTVIPLDLSSQPSQYYIYQPSPLATLNVIPGHVYCSLPVAITGIVMLISHLVILGPYRALIVTCQLACTPS